MESEGKEVRVDFLPEQQEAIRLPGPVLVVAGPGAGKTAVLTERIRYAIRERGIDPRCILAVTFTRASAAEMRERFLRLCPEGADVSFHTFHGAFLRMLRAEGMRADILSEEEQFDLVRRALKDCGWDDVISRDLGEELLRRLSVGEEEDAAGRADGPYETAGRWAGLRQRYTELKREAGRPDLSDLQTALEQLFLRDPKALARWQARFTCFLVDEFQDASPVQYRLIRLLSEPSRELFLVGDDDQAIYRFRGAAPALMQRAAAEIPGMRVVRLSVNHRCSPRITAAAGKLIRHNRTRFAKKIRSAAPDGPPVRFAVYPDEREQARGILAAMQGLLAGESAAVLVRTHQLRRRIEQEIRAGGRSLPDRVRILTMHGAKGLEFDRVWIPDCCAGVLPHIGSPGREGTEEERRLLYVAMTRARKELILSAPLRRFGKPCRPSPFLREIGLAT